MNRNSVKGFFRRAEAVVLAAGTLWAASVTAGSETASAALAALFLAVSFLEPTTEYGITGLLCVLAVAAAWGAGRLKAGKHEKAQLDQMKAKDL